MFCINVEDKRDFGTGHESETLGVAYSLAIRPRHQSVIG
jgi:hypothetical protein